MGQTQEGRQQRMGRGGGDPGGEAAAAEQRGRPHARFAHKLVGDREGAGCGSRAAHLHALLQRAPETPHVGGGGGGAAGGTVVAKVLDPGGVEPAECKRSRERRRRRRDVRRGWVALAARQALLQPSRRRVPSPGFKPPKAGKNRLVSSPRRACCSSSTPRGTRSPARSCRWCRSRGAAPAGLWQRGSGRRWVHVGSKPSIACRLLIAGGGGGGGPVRGGRDGGHAPRHDWHTTGFWNPLRSLRRKATMIPCRTCSAGWDRS